ncbi:hypothetical protein MPTK2_1g21690 [Marchantia polymorpha subsp. ruderalis]
MGQKQEKLGLLDEGKAQQAAIEPDSCRSVWGLSCAVDRTKGVLEDFATKSLCPKDRRGSPQGTFLVATHPHTHTTSKVFNVLIFR